MNFKVMLAVTLVLLCALPAFADATSTAAVFNLAGGSYADTQGSGATLVGNGGTLGPDGYTFTAGQGLSLATGSPILDQTNYSIEMVFSVSNTSGWVKLIDFKNLTADAGLYLLNGNLDFYQVGGSTGNVAPNTLTDLIITRDGATNQFAAYVNGVNVMSFVDVSNFATFQNIAFFMQDDNTTGGHESSGGTVSLIIYDPPAPVPEPTSLVLLGSGLLGMGAQLRRRLR